MEFPTATVVASCFRRNVPLRSAGRLRTLMKESTTSLAWSEFETSVTGLATYIAGSFVVGVGYWPGGAEPTAAFKITGDLQEARNTAISIAKEFGQQAVRVNFESAAEPMLLEYDMSLSDWRIEYLLPRRSTLAMAEAAYWLARDAPTEMPAGRVMGDRIVIDGGLGFVAKAHRTIVERYGRPISVGSVRVERWGSDGEQRGFVREQRIERASEEDLGRILLA